MLDAVNACYSAQRRNRSAGQRQGYRPGAGTRDARRLIAAHAPRADRTGNAACKLLGVLAAPAGADLHDAHNTEEYLFRQADGKGLSPWRYPGDIPAPLRGYQREVHELHLAPCEPSSQLYRQLPWLNGAGKITRLPR